MNLIVYGSLIKTKELKDTVDLEKDIEELIPVRVRNFRRLFNKISSRRSGEGNKIAVLNVEYTGSENDFFNGVLLTRISRRAEIAFNQRESGYTVMKVNPCYISSYDTTLEINEEACIYTAVDYMKSKNIDPIPGYARLCLRGAKEWGEKFLHDFIESTYDAKGKLFYKTENWSAPSKE